MPFVTNTIANDQRAVRDKRRTPYFDQQAGINGALVDFLAERAGSVAILEIAEAGRIVYRNVDLAVISSKKIVLVTAIELGLCKELVVRHASGLGDLGQRNEIAGS